MTTATPEWLSMWINPQILLIIAMGVIAVLAVVIAELRDALQEAKDSREDRFHWDSRPRTWRRAASTEVTHPVAPDATSPTNDPLA